MPIVHVLQKKFLCAILNQVNNISYLDISIIKINMLIFKKLKK